MASINKVILIGNLGRDPEVRYTPSGAAICNVSIATTRKWKDKNSGEQQEESEWHRVVFYDRLAEIAGEYLKKGRPVYIEGRLKTRKWQSQDGRDNYTTEIIADSLQMLGARDEAASAPAAAPSSAAPANAATQAPRPRAAAPAAAAPAGGDGFDDMEDDIPF